MKKYLMLSIILLLCSCGSGEALDRVNNEEKRPTLEVEVIQKKPLVQMAILLDTSGSMSGLINQARTELWAIVNEFIFAQRNGLEPEVQVSLYEYGKSSLPSSEGYIRMIVPLSTDLDKISEELFALTTNGGSEYCGWVIKNATQELKWSQQPDDLKVIFIAGNEPFTQGNVDYRKSCKTAVTKGIIVNTIHCGGEQIGIDSKWKDGAILADGRFLNIDQNRQVVHIEAPQDKEITELGIKLNDTYIGYGSYGKANSLRQSQQDINASNSSREAAIQRSVAKSSYNYTNAEWDLIDGINDNRVKLEELETKALPENMQKMSSKEQKEYVEKMAKERSEIQAKIAELNAQRKKYVAEQMKKQHGSEKTLGSAAIRTVREQAKKRNFKFKSEK
ncbi:MAG: vWA domain-containing protein [Planctomycetota bacterium]|jgi:hypothetical protein